MTWNFMQVEIAEQDRIGWPMIGPGGLTREQAHAEIQSILDQVPALAATWRRGARDDTVHAGPFIWCIYEHDGVDPQPAALVWLEDLAATMRRVSGADVQVARPREGGGR